MLKLKDHFSLSNLLSFTICMLGCFCCYFLQSHFSLSDILASALIGFIGSFIPYSKLYDHKKLIAAFYTGSFASMCSMTHFPTLQEVFFLSLITAIIFHLTSDLFRGFGGKLGSIAFISSLLFIILHLPFGPLQ